MPEPLPTVPGVGLRPFVSVLVLRHTTGPVSAADLAPLQARLELLSRRKNRGKAEVVARGLDALPTEVTAFIERLGNSGGASAFVVRTSRPPSWASADGGFSDISHDLTHWVWFGDLVAIMAQSNVLRGVERWIDNAPRPPFRRVPKEAFNGAFLQGEAKTLWLQGVHSRRNSKANSKSLSGDRVQSALTPLEDSTFAMSAARSALPDHAERNYLRGTIGTTPKHSTVWSKASESHVTYLMTVVEILTLISATITDGNLIEAPYDWLSTEINDLSPVRDAFDLRATSADDLPTTGDGVDEMREAAIVLEEAALVLSPWPVHGTPNFLLDAGPAGAIAGTLAVEVLANPSGGVSLTFTQRAVSDPPGLALVRDALRYSDLLTVYYGSGHTIHDGTIYKYNLGEAKFPNWEWHEFSGVDICAEKPRGSRPQEIHDLIATANDVSLFGWVVSNLGQEGFLTCDDGSNEVADFVHLSDDYTLTLVHVKGAKSHSPYRRVAVADYEVVASQAAKNLIYTDVQNLVSRLQNCRVARPATWYKGERQPDRIEMLDFLSIRPPGATCRVVIVQPQLRRNRYEEGWRAAGSESLKVRLLDTLMNSARGSAIAVGADLTVWASEDI